MDESTTQATAHLASLPTSRKQHGAAASQVILVRDDKRALLESARHASELQARPPMECPDTATEWTIRLGAPAPRATKCIWAKRHSTTKHTRPEYSTQATVINNHGSEDTHARPQVIREIHIALGPPPLQSATITILPSHQHPSCSNLCRFVVT